MSDVELWTDDDLNEAMEQILVEIETGTSSQALQHVCNICLKSYATYRGLQLHFTKVHTLPVASQLSIIDLKFQWDKAIAQCATYTSIKELEIPASLADILLHAFNHNVCNVNFTREYLKIMHTVNAGIEMKTALVELLPHLQHFKVSSSSKLSTSPAIALTHDERDICFYIGGRVLRSIYYKTGDSVLLKLKGDVSPVEFKNCWGINETAKPIFLACEQEVKADLHACEELDPSYIAEKVLQNCHSLLNSWSIAVGKESEDASKLISMLLEKYVRTRGHSYAKRLTNLYQTKKRLIQKKVQRGKGKRASFRQDLLSSTSSSV